MTLYVTNELAFEVPDEPFEDLTIHRLCVPLPGDQELGLHIERTPMPPESDLTEEVRAHVEGKARRLSFHRVIEVRERLFAGSAAIEVLSGWAHRELQFYTREVHVAALGMRLTFSTTAPLERQEACDAYFDQLVSTLEFNPR